MTFTQYETKRFLRATKISAKFLKGYSDVEMVVSGVVKPIVHKVLIKPASVNSWSSPVIGNVEIGVNDYWLTISRMYELEDIENAIWNIMSKDFPDLKTAETMYVKATANLAYDVLVRLRA